MDRLAVIGGTLGLFTGFSIISGIEVITRNEHPSNTHPSNSSQIIYFLIKLVLGMLESPKKSREKVDKKELAAGL